jgi:uncharacterized protein YbjT (DUF2867 family)
MARILVAGAAGFLGRAIVAEALRAGHEVVALVRRGGDPRLKGWQARLAEERVADVADPDQLRGACRGIEYLVSTVGMTRPQPGRTHDEVDYRGNLNLLTESLRSGVKQFAYVSVVNAELAPDVPVMQAKHRFEQALARSGMPHLVIRPSGLFHDYGAVMAMAKKGRVFVFGDGSARSTPVAERDVAQVLIGRLGEGTETVDVGGPEDLSFRDVAERAFEALGREPRIGRLPTWTLSFAARAARPLSTGRYGTFKFVEYLMRHDNVADHLGSTPIDRYFQALARSDGSA